MHLIEASYSLHDGISFFNFIFLSLMIALSFFFIGDHERKNEDCEGNNGHHGLTSYRFSSSFDLVRELNVGLSVRLTIKDRANNHLSSNAHILLDQRREKMVRMSRIPSLWALEILWASQRLPSVDGPTRWAQRLQQKESHSFSFLFFF